MIVQNAAIPLAMLGNDLLCQAKSGMGKTMVFVLSILQQIATQPKNDSVQGLVICHTRELAYQLCSEFERFSKYLKLEFCVFYGGVPEETNRRELEHRNPCVVIGTPGRLKALIKRGILDTRNVQFFVVDEVDKIIDTAMRPDFQYIFKQCPVNKQVMMFTATLSEDIRMLCKKFMANPQEMIINSNKTLVLVGILQFWVDTTEGEKTKRVLGFLDNLEYNQVVIFVKSRHRAEDLSNVLTKWGFKNQFIHGKLKQKERIARFAKFKNFHTRILVATDLVSRGIDIKRVNIVINYDFPIDEHTYLHRIGRTGRFGTKGMSISFVTKKERELFKKIQNMFESTKDIGVMLPMPDKISVDEYM